VNIIDLENIAARVLGLGGMARYVRSTPRQDQRDLK
jgi:hypothetical protein